MLSKPSLDPSAGSSGDDVHLEVEQIANRVGVLGAVQAMQRRRVEAGLRIGGRVEPRLERRGKRVEPLARRTRRAARRHHAGPDLANDLLPPLAMRADTLASELSVAARARRSSSRSLWQVRQVPASGTPHRRSGRLQGGRRRARRLPRLRAGGPGADPPGRPAACPATIATATTQSAASGKNSLDHGYWATGPVPSRLLISAIELGFGLAGMRREEDTFRPRQRACALPCPSRRASRPSRPGT